MKIRRFRRWASGALLAAVSLSFSGCLSASEPLFPLFWLGTFQPVAGAPIWVGGTSEMVANVADSSVGVFLEGEPGFSNVVSWQVRNGACSGSGDRIAPPSSFPAVTLSEGGTGLGIAEIRRRIPSGEYAAEVFSGPDGTGERLACANLTQQ